MRRICVHVRLRLTTLSRAGIAMIHKFGKPGGIWKLEPLPVIPLLTKRLRLFDEHLGQFFGLFGVVDVGIVLLFDFAEYLELELVRSEFLPFFLQHHIAVVPEIQFQAVAVPDFVQVDAVVDEYLVVDGIANPEDPDFELDLFVSVLEFFFCFHHA